ncbi:MAG: glycoside hydrolase, partial [candidate division Zixibacteria bacterium]|nr:glycoside hydrolase [candidate division Zixibacteria bacterium]
MFSSKNKTFLVFLIILSSLLVSTAIFAVDKRELPSAQKANFVPRDISSQNEVNEFFKPSRWGNDDTITTGPVYQGISSDYDTSGNLYAVRCSTYIDSSNACVKVYKSVNGGASWFSLCGVASGWGFKYSYPVALTGSIDNKLYVFFLFSPQNGDIRMARFTQSGTFEEFCDVKAGADTITYFSACTDDGSHLMVAYQKEEGWHRLYTITSTDSGETWGNEVLVCSDGAHPDITYGSNGYVYVVFESTGMTKGKSADEDKEIWFRRNPDYCAPGSWEVMEILTDDSYEDSYPKVAALHTTPESTACVWVAYNHTQVERDTLRYDDGTAYYVLPIPNTWEVDLFNVRFTPSSGYSLKSAQFLFYRKAGTGGIRVYVWADTSGFPAQKIDSVDVPDANIQLYPNWTTVDFSSKNTTLSKVTDFHIGYTLLGPSSDSVFIMSDDGEPVGTEHRSIDSDYGTWETMYSWFGHDVNFMIRADVERMQSTDLRFAYSTNSGKNWTKDQVLADDPS